MRQDSQCRPATLAWSLNFKLAAGVQSPRALSQLEMQLRSPDATATANRGDGLTAFHPIPPAH